MPRTKEWYATQVTVCSECFKASCWHGIFMCESAREASTVEMTRRQLLILDKEHPCYFSNKTLYEQTGDEMYLSKQKGGV